MVFEVLLGTLKMKRRPCRIAVPIDRNIKEWHWWDMPYYKLGEEAIFCGYSLSQERVFFCSLARPTFQAVSPSIALPWQSTAEYSSVAKKGKKSHGQRNFSSCLKPSSVSLYFISTFFSRRLFLLGHIVYSFLFLLPRAFLGVTVQIKTFLPIIFRLFQVSTSQL